MSFWRKAIWISLPSSARARSSSCIARVGTTVTSPIGGGLPTRLGGAFHLGQPAAVGADGGEQVVLPFELHAAQGVAAALVVGGEDGAADQLAEEPAREFVAGRFAELGDRRELGRIGDRQLELAALAADRACPRCPIRCGRCRRCSRGGWSRIGRPAAARSRVRRRRCPSRRSGCRLPDRSPSAWPHPSATSSLTLCSMGLGLRTGAIGATVWNACNNFSRLQVIFIATTFWS